MLLEGRSIFNFNTNNKNMLIKILKMTFLLQIINVHSLDIYEQLDINLK